MDVSMLDPSHGHRIASQVRSLFGLSVTSPSPDDADSFWLFAAFSRSRVKLCDQSVGSILQSILGGCSVSFAVVQLEDGIFKFSLRSTPVGLFIYKLGSFACKHFKAFFHLWNDKGLTFARKSVMADRSPQYEWQEVKAKRNTKRLSPIPVKHVFARLHSDLNVSSTMSKPSVFSRLHFGAATQSVWFLPNNLSSHQFSLDWILVLFQMRHSLEKIRSCQAELGWPKFKQIQILLRLLMNTTLLCRLN